ncbi:MAG TPA: phospholipase D-like domain-containing protein, partial [Armatimonadota bacterium]|nr:phospholipase D-like domain-containing protein [Armatimonadota bacterium]
MENSSALGSSSIIDNRDGNTLLAGLQRIGEQGRDLRIAAAFFSLDALLLLANQLEHYDRIRILFGDDASPRQRRALLQMLRATSDRDLLNQREKDAPLLTALRKVEALFAAGRVEARCYTSEKFHAKAYLVQRDVFPPQLGVLGSGNFTRPGLLQNVELNVLLTPEQTAQLDAWYEARWAEAAEDVVTEDLLEEIRRQLELYDPYILYLKALYLWGKDRQGAPEDAPTRLLGLLDKHQEEGYYQALRILERDHGVMICDGVGLGKSFIALALMDHYCRAGKNVLLLAPKNILTNSWDGYLKEYLARYRSPFGNIHEMPMTELGFKAGDLPQFGAASSEEENGPTLFTLDDTAVSTTALDPEGASG